MQQSIFFALHDVFFTASASTGLRRSRVLQYRRQLALSYTVAHPKPRLKCLLNLLTNVLWPRFCFVPRPSVCLLGQTHTVPQVAHPASRAKYTGEYTEKFCNARITHKNSRICGVTFRDTLQKNSSISGKEHIIAVKFFKNIGTKPPVRNHEKSKKIFCRLVLHFRVHSHICNNRM